MSFPLVRTVEKVTFHVDGPPMRKGTSVFHSGCLCRPGILCWLTHEFENGGIMIPIDHSDWWARASKQEYTEATAMEVIAVAARGEGPTP